MINDDTHDKLTKAYLEYYKANEAWEIRKSERTKRSARKWLSEIRRLCSDRRVEIIEEYKAKKETSSSDTE
jgi:transposase|tara:strand:- start:1326 stop:1538 length:213 start_codon:yes stop_codon:yes gene_type:complete